MDRHRWRSRSGRTYRPWRRRKRRRMRMRTCPRRVAMRWFARERQTTSRLHLGGDDVRLPPRVVTDAAAGLGLGIIQQRGLWTSAGHRTVTSSPRPPRAIESARLVRRYGALATPLGTLAARPESLVAFTVHAHPRDELGELLRSARRRVGWAGRAWLVGQGGGRVACLQRETALERRAGDVDTRERRHRTAPRGRDLDVRVGGELRLKSVQRSSVSSIGTAPRPRRSECVQLTRNFGRLYSAYTLER